MDEGQGGGITVGSSRHVPRRKRGAASGHDFLDSALLVPLVLALTSACRGIALGERGRGFAFGSLAVAGLALALISGNGLLRYSAVGHPGWRPVSFVRIGVSVDAVGFWFQLTFGLVIAAGALAGWGPAEPVGLSARTGGVYALAATAICLTVAMDGVPPFGMFLSEFGIASGGLAGRGLAVAATVAVVLLIGVMFVGLLWQGVQVVYGTPPKVLSYDASK